MQHNLKEATLYGQEDITVADILEHYKYCTAQNGKNKFLKTTRKATNKTSCNSAAKKTFQKSTKTVVFTCDLPYTFSDIAKLPETIKQHLQSVELKDTLKAEFGVSENNEAIYLKYLDAGAGSSFPKAGNAKKNRSTVAALHAGEVIAPSHSVQEIIPGSKGITEEKKAIREALIPVIKDSGKFIKVNLPADYQHWYYSEAHHNFYLMDIDDFAWNDSEPNDLTGTVKFNKTETDLTP